MARSWAARINRTALANVVRRQAPDEDVYVPCPTWRPRPSSLHKYRVPNIRCCGETRSRVAVGAALAKRSSIARVHFARRWSIRRTHGASSLRRRDPVKIPKRCRVSSVSCHVNYLSARLIWRELTNNARGGQGTNASSGARIRAS